MEMTLNFSSPEFLEMTQEWIRDLFIQEKNMINIFIRIMIESSKFSR